MTKNGAAVKSITKYGYYLKDGDTTLTKTRTDYTDGSKSFSWPVGTKMADVALYLQPDIADVFGDDPILLVEGEKTADALKARGYVAVSLPGGSGQSDLSALDILYWPGSTATIYICPDNDKVGLKAATAWYEHLKSAYPKVKWVPPVVETPGGDFADLLSDFSADEDAEARFEIASRLDAAVDGPPGLTPVEVPKKQSQWEDFNDLADEPDEEMVSFGLFSEGTWIIAGAPKLGKSWFALSYAHGLALGGAVLGAIMVDEPCDVLALILEDGRRRYKKRIKERISTLDRPERGRFLVRFKWDRLDEESLGRLETEIAIRAVAGRKVCVVIDTGTKLRPLEDKQSSIYMGDYNFLDPLTEVAQRHHCLIMVIAHTRKAVAVDFIDSVIGSHGISGAVDGIAVLSRERHSKQATLEVTGRDGDEAKHYLAWDPISNGWLLTEQPDELTANRRAVQGVIARIKTCIAEQGRPMGVKELRVALAMKQNTVTDALDLGVQWGDLTKSGDGLRGSPALYDLPNSVPGIDTDGV